MWIFALLGIGAAFLLGKRSAEHARPQYALPAAYPVAGPPTPMDVLCQLVRTNRQPPPMVIMCALAQVESMGRRDLAQDIIRLFVLPTVQANQLAREAAGELPQGQPQMPPLPSSQAPINQGDGSQTPGSGVTASLTDDQIQAMLNADPSQFINRVQRGEVIDVQPPVEQQAHQAQAEEQPQVQVSGTIIGSMPALPSPIREIDSGRWSTFTERLAREEPTFVSARHVGRYRQNKERLSELGIDPRALVGSAEAQRRALDRDLADAHRHADDSGMAADHVNRTITLPDGEAPVRVTLSGILGVVQAAGLEGAVGWLESYHDRKRFPHTTQAFKRTNGMF